MSIMGSRLMQGASASTAQSISREMSSSLENITAGIQTAQSSAGVDGIKGAMEAFSAEKMGSTQLIQSAKMSSIASIAGYPSPTKQLKQSPASAKYQKVLQHMENPKFQSSKGLQRFAQMKLSSQIAAMPLPPPSPDAGNEGRRIIDADGFANIAQTLLRTETSALNLAQMSDTLNQTAISGGWGNDNVSILGGIRKR